ncbi:N-acetyl-gamma-glutamyl-phosphate reductase [Leptospira levettii]|uniref:N-acetyl-gamma-glutamyl-phosphate reductase n=1 Tax=Leptospira levettii TaxID=2023178 RepID=A0ABY2MIG4_9LEPT|nr:N-acetyl-gamma-glutamyl-phosphate reductase [Leptospira levettii]TGL67144.1 N-acetyl-gamma-glutamyl-phosphate reductase [Leptospira levettii]TGM28437.1 N-acetyl-gamma-glutamyl-phosphate reductase [Leptospira levettii]TGM83171.1 N-acetyl-gamma-glutamyl-phosphate reductase [Leptospira levettii]
MKQTKIAIIGAGGLTGKELVGLLAHHPHFQVVHITSNQVDGKHIREVFPDLSHLPDLRFQKHDAPIPEDAHIVLATPNEVSLEKAPEFLQQGKKVIDLSGTFRLHDQNQFESAYKFKHTKFEWMDKVVFGLPELFREKIKNANFISNPGCFATSAILPIAILGNLRKKIQGPVIVDAKSGVSGAGGRTEEIKYAYTHVYENFRAYKVLSHQHEPEMEEYSFVGSEPKKIHFTPHLLPVYRGILATIYITFENPVDPKEVKEKIQSVADKETFIRFYETPEEIEIRKVQNTNFLDIGFTSKGNTLVLVTALDNLVKGAAGQALQNLNLMFGYPETLGLVTI